MEERNNKEMENKLKQTKMGRPILGSECGVFVSYCISWSIVLFGPANKTWSGDFVVGLFVFSMYMFLFFYVVIL
jgi:hypothetical protein